jgi:hypothetical protein
LRTGGNYGGAIVRKPQPHPQIFRIWSSVPELTRLTDPIDFVSFALILSIVQTGLLLSQTRYARHQWDVRACWYDGKYTKVSSTHHILTSSRRLSAVTDPFYATDCFLMRTLLFQRCHLSVILPDLRCPKADAHCYPGRNGLRRRALLHQHPPRSNPIGSSCWGNVAKCSHQWTSPERSDLGSRTSHTWDRAGSVYLHLADSPDLETSTLKEEEDTDFDCLYHCLSVSFVVSNCC